jgi:hypothetical protein
LREFVAGASKAGVILLASAAVNGVCAMAEMAKASRTIIEHNKMEILRPTTVTVCGGGFYLKGRGSV